MHQEIVVMNHYEIGTIEKNDSIVFIMKDNGRGITKEEQKNIFTKFYQVNSSFIRSHYGIGLGLLICQKLVNTMGDKMWLESEKGRGATFYFSLKKGDKKLES